MTDKATQNSTPTLQGESVTVECKCKVLLIYVRLLSLKKDALFFFFFLQIYNVQFSVEYRAKV